MDTGEPVNRALSIYPYIRQIQLKSTLPVIPLYILIAAILIAAIGIPFCLSCIFVSYLAMQKGRLKNCFSDDLCSHYLFPESMPKMANACYHHGDAVFVGRIKNFLIAHRACGVDDGFDALFGNHVHAVAEREEGIGGSTCAI